jgi:hypothetical protein
LYHNAHVGDLTDNVLSPQGQNSLSRRVGIEHVAATPKAKQNFESQIRAKQFFYSRHVAAPTQPPAMQ